MPTPSSIAPLAPFDATDAFRFTPRTANRPLPPLAPPLVARGSRHGHEHRCVAPDVLLQAIDSFIDLYADEEREYDVRVFREGGMLEALEGAVAGVRAAVRPFPLCIPFL